VSIATKNDCYWSSTGHEPLFCQLKGLYVQAFWRDMIPRTQIYQPRSQFWQQMKYDFFYNLWSIGYNFCLSTDCFHGIGLCVKVTKITLTELLPNLQNQSYTILWVQICNTVWFWRHETICTTVIMTWSWLLQWLHAHLLLLQSKLDTW